MNLLQPCTGCRHLVAPIGQRFAVCRVYDGTFVAEVDPTTGRKHWVHKPHPLNINRGIATRPTTTAMRANRAPCGPARYLFEPGLLLRLWWRLTGRAWQRVDRSRAAIEYNRRVVDSIHPGRIPRGNPFWHNPKHADLLVSDPELRRCKWSTYTPRPCENIAAAGYDECARCLVEDPYE